MGIVLKTPQDAIAVFFAKSLEIIKEELTKALAYLGEQAVTKVRDREEIDSWYDHTGNLRSSIGYSVIEHGKILIESAFVPVKGGMKGQSEGRRMVEELASKYSQTYALVVVAGMSYAELVEAIESKDVLASTEIWAKQKVDSYLEKAKDRALKRINALQL